MVTISVFDALSIGSGLVAAVVLCIKRELRVSNDFFNTTYFELITQLYQTVTYDSNTHIAHPLFALLCSLAKCFIVFILAPPSSVSFSGHPLVLPYIFLH